MRPPPSRIAEFLDFNESIYRQAMDSFDPGSVHVTISLNIPATLREFLDMEEEFKRICDFFIQRSSGEGILLKTISSYPNHCFAVCQVEPLNLSPAEIKRYFSSLEEGLPGGRIMDIDVYSGRTLLTRERARTCFVCRSSSHEKCRREQTHSTREVIFSFLKLYARFHHSNLDPDQQIPSARCRRDLLASLLSEVLFVKPFLVSPAGQGIHHDMDFRLFLKSIFSIYRDFDAFLYLGGIARDDESAFFLLKTIGQSIEDRMFQATCGVNTHKGAIFLFGVLFTALGYQYRNRSPWLDMVKVFGRLSMRDFADQEISTSGVRLFGKHGVKGIRGECESGLQTALLALEWSRKLDLDDFDQRHYLLLMYILARAEDTNVIKKSGIEEFRSFQEELSALIDRYPEVTFEKLDSKVRGFLGKYSASPGGSADILSITVFLGLMRFQKENHRRS